MILKSGMQDANKNEVILTGLEFKKFNVDTKGNYFNAKWCLKED